MEPKEQEQNILTEYAYLESLLKHYSNPYDKNNLSLEEYLIILHRIIFKIQDTSKQSDVERTENFFYELIKTSLRLDKDSLLFIVVSYFIQKGFDEFIKVLKDIKVTTPKEFNKLLLNILDSEKIEDSFQLNKGEIEKVLNIPAFKKTFTKLKFKNKIMCFILFLFRDFVEKKDQQIIDGIKDYLDEDNINQFYTIYDKEIKQNNEYKNLAQELSPLNGHETKTFFYNDDNEDKIAKLRKEINDLRESINQNNQNLNELEKKIKELEPLKKKVAQLEKNARILDEKITLSLFNRAPLDIILKKKLEYDNNE